MTTEFHETAWNPESAEGPPGLNAWSAMDLAGQCEFPSADPDVPEIWLYSDRMSYFPGDEVVFYVHTSVPTYSIVFERDGASLDKVHEMNGLIGTRQKTPEDAYKNGCDWQESFRYRIPADWKSGVYIVSASCEDAEKITHPVGVQPYLRHVRVCHGSRRTVRVSVG